jgi:uncharacterized protein
MPAETPAIQIRNLRFSREAAHYGRWWHGGDPVATAFFNALSSTFPEGERFFMDSVRFYRREVPDELAGEIAAFLGQEAVHSREHGAFNAIAAEAGYDIARLEARSKAPLDQGRGKGPVAMLAATCALEHFTAILAHALLARGGCDLAGAAEEARRLWTWHAIEEIEHKAVAYDTYLHISRGWSRWRRWKVRSHAMLIATAHFLRTLFANLADLYRQDGIHGPRTWARTSWYLFGLPGVLRRTFLPWLAYFRPGFHPWDRDDRALIEGAAARIV